jgi:Domain of unknown function (DUF3859)
MRIVASLLLLILLSIRAYAQAPQINRIDVVEYGIYTADEQGHKSVPGAAAGTENIVSNIHHTLTTRNVPAQQGVHFGFLFTPIGEPEDKIATVRQVTIFPSSGLRNPSTQQLFVQEEYDIDVRIGKTNFKGYGFDNHWEVVPGVWTFQLWYQGRKMVDQVFTVAKQ